MTRRSPGPAGRRLIAAGIVTGALVVLAGVAAAQDAPAPTDTPPAAPDTAATAPPAPGATTVPPTTIPAGCTAAPAATAQFVGKVLSGTDTLVTFSVTQLRAGALPATDVTVDYGANDDRRFLESGHSYLVVASTDPESQRLVSKVRRPREEPTACAPFDPIYTRHADGTAIDSSLLAGMQGKWGEVGMAFLIPTAVVFAVLIALVILKHSVLLTGRGVRYARDRHRSRSSPPGGRPPRAGGPPPPSRTRTRTAPPAPG
jgi:hypothetical protein